MHCSRCAIDYATLFCPYCGKANREDLKSVIFKGFTGASSLNDNVVRFFETGDPSGC